MRRDYPLLYAAILVLIAVLQSSLLNGISVYNIQADFTLIVLVFFSHQLGSFQGKIVGFTAGLVLDFLSMAPLGFHCFIFTLIGHIYGLSRGKVFIDTVSLPAILIVSATLMKMITSFLLVVIFLPEKIGDVFTLSSFIQLGLHGLLAPFVFVLLKLSRLSREHETQTKRL